MSTKSITSASAVQGVATDARIGRNRTLIVIAESAAGPGYAQARANFEARIRKARGDLGEVVVQGWRVPDGKLWAVNRQVWVSSISTRLGGFYLISDVEFIVDETNGSTTRLKLKDPDAYLAALEFAAVDAKDIDGLESKKSLRRAKKAGRQSIREIL